MFSKEDGWREGGGEEVVCVYLSQIVGQPIKIQVSSIYFVVDGCSQGGC